MKSPSIHHGHVGIVALLLALGGCTASASFRAGSTSTSSARGEHTAARAQVASPRSESTSGSRKEALAERDAPDAQEPATGVVRLSPEKKPAPQTVAASPERDHDRGHGNDADGVDEDNPGKSKRDKEKPAKSKKPSQGKKAGAAVAASQAAEGDRDRDRGHGNDEDGVDEDNPGKSRGK
jgi:hypothetical protein